MKKKIRKELPKLPRGVGTYDYISEDTDTIRYRKNITINSVTERLVVYGNTISEVNKLMKDEESSATIRLKLQETNVAR